jgi:hypothetical protein
MRAATSYTVSVAVALVMSGGGAAEAQPLGTFTWQLQPFCNTVTVSVTQNGAVYTLDGYDDQCGAPQRAPLVGLATPNPDSTIGLGLQIVTVPGGKPVSVDARITLGALGGPWADSAGNSGTLVFNGQAAGLPARPPVTLAVAALPANIVTTTTIVDGTIGAADIDSSQVQRRLTGPCARGLYMTTAAASGLPTCAAGAGLSTMLGVNAGALTTGIRNTAVGYGALAQNVSGADDTAIGTGALANSTAASGGSTAVGSNALFSLTTGFWNTAVGDLALVNLTSGADNLAVGRGALRSNVFGGSNVALGANAAFNTTGSVNIAVGKDAAANVTFGNSNIHIGNLGLAADTNTIKIGTAGTQTTAFLAGVRGVTTATAAIPVLVGTDGQLGTASSSRRFKNDIHDMGAASARLFELRPVTFRYTQPMADGSTPLDFGLIAEEVAEVFPELAVRGADGQVETVHYHKLPALLLNELQKQQRTIDAQAAALAALEARLAAIETSAPRHR